ncbi:Xyloside xylosyltransferase 1 [Ameca splendens]|uniref:Xyloside xylosyltransferase 1 n=1 Tax=Ameca splendens TaxID=208324 RepID=A0ABV1AD54_9TELE
MTIDCFHPSTQIIFHDVVELTQKLFPIVEAMQKHFSAGSGAYYSDSIFFLSVAMHHIMPDSGAQLDKAA